VQGGTYQPVMADQLADEAVVVAIAVADMVLLVFMGLFIPNLVECVNI
jgi:hypothetical protein